MGGLFINYRREDAAAYAGRIYDYLQRAFPDSEIFMDVEVISPGEDFIEAINARLAESKVVLAVIGPGWTSVTDSGGVLRLDDPEDYVVRELDTALKSKALVIPVLVGGAKMPAARALPHRLKPLGRRNAIEISDSRFYSDAQRLVQAIGQVMGGLDADAQGGPAVPVSEKATSLAEAMTIFKTLLWSNFALAFLVIPVTFVKDLEGSWLPIAIQLIILITVAGWLNVKLIQGRNWARICFIGSVVLVTPLIPIAWDQQSGIEVSIKIVGLVLNLWIIRVMVTEPVRRIFRSSHGGIKK